MRPLPALLAAAAFVACTQPASTQQPFTLQQALHAPYSTNLTAAKMGYRMAWVEHVDGRNNLWVYIDGDTSTPNGNTHQLTHNTQDDAQDINSLAWSPDASLIAFVYGAASGASGRPANPAHLQRPTPVEIYVQPVTGGDPIRLGEGRAPLFAPDGKSIYFLRSGQIMQAQLAAGKSAPAQPVLYDRGTASQMSLSPDGTKLAYISHRRTHSFLAVFNLVTKELTFPSPSTGNDAAPIFSRDGKLLAWIRYPWTDMSEFAGLRTSANPWSIQIADVATQKVRTLFTPEANKPGSVEPRMATGDPHLFFTADNHVLFFSEADGWVHLYAISGAGGLAPTLLTPGHYEVEDAAIDPQGTTLVYASNEMGQSHEPGFEDTRHIWSIDLHAPYARKQLSTTQITTHPQITGHGVVCALMSTTALPMFPIQLMKPSGYVALHFSLPPDMESAAKDFVRPQLVLFPSSDKVLELHGQLFLPKPTNGKHPAILFFHGGPKRQMLLGYPAMDYYSNAYAMNQYLASRGYIVLSVNYRGGIGYGLDFRQCQHCGGDGAAEYADALGAAAYLRSRPDVDAAHIGLWGGSYGGYFTALALARNSDIFAAGVDFHGVHEWAREDNAPADWLRSATADPAEISRIAALAHASSPMADVDKWRSPILFIHGDDDPDVAYIQTPLLADALRARQVHVEELIFPDELHGFVLHRDWMAAYEAAANFFDRTLKPSEAPGK